MIANLREPAELYAEEIPIEETNLTDDAKVIDVFHYHREPQRYFGVPFRFVVKSVSDGPQNHIARIHAETFRSLPGRALRGHKAASAISSWDR